MKLNKFFYILVMTIFIWSCKKDDGIIEADAVPPQTLSETAVEDEKNIQAYLNSHFYNYEEFANPPADFDFKIVVDSIEGDNSDKTPLVDQVLTKTISVTSNVFNLSSEEETVAHNFYYLIAREGLGEALSVADSALVRYKGFELDGDVFDGVEQSPIWFDLATIQGAGAARGFAEGTKELKTGGEIIENGDGTFTVQDYGIGMIIMPSGLGYFNASRATIPAYSPLIFTIDLFAMNATDHDRDGIPSILEDIDGDGYLYSDNTDLETETGLRFANFIDADDDGDGVSTRDEISDADGNIIVPYPDFNNDGTPDYLDASYQREN